MKITGHIIYDSGGNEINANSNRLYQIENEPYHSVRFLKSSTYGENIYLEGAEFNLSGISDYGTSVNMNAVSGRAEDGVLWSLMALNLEHIH